MLRIGNGYDVHKLVEGRKLMLGGVEVPHTKGVLAILMEMYFYML